MRHLIFHQQTIWQMVASNQELGSTVYPNAKRVLASPKKPSDQLWLQHTYLPSHLLLRQTLGWVEISGFQFQDFQAMSSSDTSESEGNTYSEFAKPVT